ncbi:hypothetical protein H310_01657 [Aphanomyces invadans]|uniref:Uncharacterized protein n=1 Tax=Aphanomyces invadans TaxID=157072 RepID=A0A024UUB6_9STRA|nr:hypothetical protein H310_01657 [Aphanomyces invadans]ETW09258.1 hypothetical protein H310_01657 [Aphanomyces invadans]|eukprot:XP_008863063.1 hypothetical protein H310_01657 [Aphanomyces invadans]
MIAPPCYARRDPCDDGALKIWYFACRFIAKLVSALANSVVVVGHFPCRPPHPRRTDAKKLMNSSIVSSPRRAINPTSTTHPGYWAFMCSLKAVNSNGCAPATQRLCLSKSSWPSLRNISKYAPTGLASNGA